ncbi:TRAP transporter substrate-binding protein [Agathobaculum sp.]|uniref:TRAP transporter substrate-binding protein n=1 Tax=Agathobaculum sp. TaxID=2048138 RepID=UPI002A83F6FC|nr:TRAP transporter substrate-binding protein [Agathobaculum sp.]MDY3618218.1 TRAP transporter substrate-binding protein [Agathobaculum sp.]
MKKTKKLFSLTSMLLCGAILLSACGTPAQNADVAEPADNGDAKNTAVTYEFTAACNVPEDTLNYAIFSKMKELLEKDERIKFNIYTNGQLGGDREMMEGLVAGNIDFVTTITAGIIDFIPEVGVFDMPNVFPDVETARKVLDGDFNTVMSEKYEAGGIKLLGTVDSGFRQLTSNKPIQTIDDLKGLKIRTTTNKNHIAYWTALGANPTPMDFGEVYIGLQQGTIDAEENPYDFIVSNKFYEAQKYVVETNHVIHATVLIANNKTYQALPDDIKAFVDQCAAEAIASTRLLSDKNIKEKKQFVQDNGMTILVPDDALRAAIKERAETVYDSIRQAVGNDLVDKLLEEVEKASH